MRKVLENGDRLAVISGGDKIVLTTIGDEVSVKEMASLAEAECLRFLLQTSPLRATMRLLLHW